MPARIRRCGLPALLAIASVATIASPPAAARTRIAAPPPPKSTPPPDFDPSMVTNWSATQPVEEMLPGPESVFATSSVIHLRWGGIKTAARYRVQLASDGDFRGVVLDRTTTSLDAVAGALRPGRYYWRVQSIDKHGRTAPWSAVNDLEVRPTDAPARVTLHWRPAIDPGLHFLVQVSKDPKLAQPLASKKTDSAFFVTEPLPRGRYFWRVTTFDADGNKVETGPVKSFTVGDAGVVSFEGG